ncbi:hypothetical protein [Azonexus sp.]|uniref:hypothetical protein n=1 Tax=Azonexus sp. TaxID=1872668 RepID=UPI0039E347E6
MTKNSIAIQAESVCDRLVGTSIHDQILAVRLFCNSDSAFVMWAKKTGADLAAIRKARSLQLAWAALKIARTQFITIKAVLATIRTMLREGKITKKYALEIFQMLFSGSQKAQNRTKKENSARLQLELGLV